MNRLERIDKFMKVGSKALSFIIAMAFLVMICVLLYYTIVYPQKIANKTKFGMTKQQIEYVYKDNHHRYYQDMIVCSVGCERNLLIENSTDNSKVVEYMVISTGIDGVFIVGFSKDGVVIFTTDGQT